MTGTLREWIRSEVKALLGRKVSPPLIIWCDPKQEWRELLQAAAEGGAFELWSYEKHELALRDELMRVEPRPRVVWLPRDADEITYMKVFELRAEYVWSEPLVAALGRFGVDIPRDGEAELREILPAHAREWIDRPLSEWKELTVGTAKATLVDDDRILEALARPGIPVGEVVGKDRVTVFVRRVTEEFGLPALEAGKDDDWRVAATARLLVTEAAVRCPGQPPPDADRIVPPGAPRDRALRMLDRWQNNVKLMPAFEGLARRADGTTSLMYWARNLSGLCPALPSRAVENALFDKEVAELEPLTECDALSRRLEEREGFYAAHAGGFWGSRAEKMVPWQSLMVLARAAVVLMRESVAERDWKAPRDAVAWFTGAGWEMDHQGEILFRDNPDFPPALQGIRARLRRAYLRHLDRINVTFSELLYQQGFQSLDLRFAGEVLAELRSARDPMAVLVLDACRYDLGKRLEERVNRGEPIQRAEVRAARAPLPSITALGVPFALADEPGVLAVELTSEPSARWCVTAKGVAGDLTSGDAGRAWLRHRFKLKPEAIRGVKEILDDQPPVPKEVGRLLFVFGTEFDDQGHEDELRFSGTEDFLDRYTRAIGRLREAGYTTVAVVTDHGFIHWEPEQDEVIEQPTGDILWRSRRAIAGRNLKHSTALRADVPQSDLECHVPRSVNAFRTYGGLGYFHGGATLQELVIPVILVRWPKKAQKVAVVLTPIGEIVSLRPRIELRPGTSDLLPGFAADERTLGRQVTVKIVEAGTGRRIFGFGKSVKIEPAGPPVSLTLDRVPRETCTRGTRLRVEVRDADNDELLDQCEVELKVDLEEWD